ncbi:MAG: tetratricopeptide repeat protein, partial [Gammaproteobacteria bacterium]|nr:tetratricopeptide repeat protein [Gammaproteobacteria bacterium]
MLLTRAFGFTVRVATLFLLLSVEGSMAGRSSELNEAIEKFDRLVREGKSQEAIPWVERAIQLAEIELDAKDPRWAGVLTHQLGAIYAELGRYAEAEPALERSLSLTKEARGNKHLDLTPILYNLAVVKIKQGRYADAEDRLSEALRLSELLLVPGDPDIAKFGELLAAVYEQLGRQAEAAAVRKRIGDSPGVVSIVSTTPGVLVKRASVYVRQGRLNEAVSVLESALAALESTSSTSHLDLTKVQHRLADILIKLGRYNDAENYLRRAIELRESALGPDHEDLAPLLESLAVLYSQHGRRRESEALYERALAIRPTDPGEDGAGTVSTLNALAAIKSRDGPIDEARDLYLRALEISRDNDRVGDRVVAASLSGLASVYAEIARRWDAVGQYDTAERLTQAAEQLFKRSLSMLTAVLGPDRVDPTLGVITNDLGWLYINAGRTDEGESFAQRSLEIKEEIYGPTHPFVAQAYSNLAALFLEQSRYDDALSYSRKGVSVMSRRITDTRRGMDTLQELEEYKQIFGTHIDVVAAISARNPPDPQSITDEAFR